MKKILLSFAALTSLSMVGMLFMNDGNLYSSSTGAPGASTCAQGGCHSDGGAAQTSADVSLVVTDGSGNPVTSYVANTQYTVTFGKHATSAKVGFALSATSGSLAKNSGDTKVQKFGTYLTHTSSGTAVSGGHAEWSAKWTAPASGNVTLQLFINETNSDGGSTGDAIFTHSVQLTPALTGLNKLGNDVSFKVYPNPTSDQLNVRFDIKYPSPIAITLMSIDGKHTTELFAGEEAKGQVDKSFDISQLAKGVYLLNIKTTEGNATQKIMIN